MGIADRPTAYPPVIARLRAHRRGNPFSVSCMQAVSCANQDPFLFSVLARKEKRFLDSKEKRALPRGFSAGNCWAGPPRISDFALISGAIVEKAVAPVSARRRFAWRCMVQAVTSCTVLLGSACFSLTEVRPKPSPDKEKRRIVAGTRLTACHSVSRTRRPFLSYTGRGAVFLFGQAPKRKIGGRNTQVTVCKSVKENGLPRRFAPRNDVQRGRAGSKGR